MDLFLKLLGETETLDVIVLAGEPFSTGTVLKARPVGYLKMTDDKGQDEKILAVPVDDPRFNERHSLKDIRKHVLLELNTFFKFIKILKINLLI